MDQTGAPAPKSFEEVGIASFYADLYQGKKTASGARYYHQEFTCAHRTLPFGTRLQVTNAFNGVRVVVTVNDRGPFVEGRIIDLSQRAFRRIATHHTLSAGLLTVTIKQIDK